MTSAYSQPDPPSHDTVKRVVELEEKLMFSQRAIDELNSVVLSQQAELERLARELQAVRSLAERAIDLGAEPGALDEKPPHY